MKLLVYDKLRYISPCQHLPTYKTHLNDNNSSMLQFLLKPEAHKWCFVLTFFQIKLLYILYIHSTVTIKIFCI